MEVREHGKFAEVMAGLLTIAAAFAVLIAVIVLSSLLFETAGEPLPQWVLEETGVQVEERPPLEFDDFLNPTTIVVFFSLLLMMLNPVQSCLYKLHPAWGIVFAAVFLSGIVALSVIAAYDPSPLLFFVLPLLYLLLGLAASIIALIVRRGEWRNRCFRDAPCFWWDIFMVYTLFAVLFIPFVAIFAIAYFVPFMLAGFCIRHIYIVRALVGENRADKMRKARLEALPRDAVHSA